MTSPIAMHGETLAPLMQKAGFRYVFLGIENILEDDLVYLKASAKNSFAKRAAHWEREHSGDRVFCGSTRCTS